MKDRQRLYPDPQTKGFVTGWVLAMSLMLFVLVLVVLPPFVPPGFRSVLMHGFSPLCHQLPDRSFQHLGISFAVCHRCFGIYTGLWLASAAFIGLWRWELAFSRHAAVLLGLSLVPLAVDWGLHVVGWWVNTPASRLITGGVFGLVAGCYFARAMIQLTTSKTVVPLPPTVPDTPPS